MAKQTTKRCHWVSQAYLRPFAADPETRSKIWRLSKTAGDAELKPIEKVAVNFHLYAPKGRDGVRDDALEKKLSGLETWFGSPVWRALCTDFVDLAWEPLRKMVALLAATTYLRNPRQLELTKQIHGRLVELYNRRPTPPEKVWINGKVFDVDPSDWPEYRDATDEDVKRHWNAEVGEAGWFASELLKMRWAMLCSDVPVFITCDNPVMLQHPSLRFRGLGDPETMVTFPISPTRLLMLDLRHGEPDGRYYPLRFDPASLNGLTWRNAIDHMFSPWHPDLVCAAMLADAERMGLAV
jgi:hypothetical protein